MKEEEKENESAKIVIKRHAFQPGRKNKPILSINSTFSKQKLKIKMSDQYKNRFKNINNNKNGQTAMEFLSFIFGKENP